MRYYYIDFCLNLIKLPKGLFILSRTQVVIIVDVVINVVNVDVVVVVVNVVVYVVVAVAVDSDSNQSTIPQIFLEPVVPFKEDFSDLNAD